MYAENLKKVRISLGMSVNELAETINVPARTIGGYERNERTPSIELATQLCNNLNVNANWFVTGKGEMFIKKSATPGSRIADIQEQNNISDYKFAEMLDIPESELTDIIIDKKEPDMRVLKNLKKHFGVSIDYIMYGE